MRNPSFTSSLIKVGPSRHIITAVVISNPPQWLPPSSAWASVGGRSRAGVEEQGGVGAPPLHVLLPSCSPLVHTRRCYRSVQELEAQRGGRVMSVSVARLPGYCDERKQTCAIWAVLLSARGLHMQWVPADGGEGAQLLHGHTGGAAGGAGGPGDGEPGIGPFDGRAGGAYAGGDQWGDVGTEQSRLADGARECHHCRGQRYWGID